MQEQPLPPMTQTEAQDLIGAISKQFGPCLCQQHAQIAGHLVWVEVCPGHAWLNEEHRLARLLWIRRTYSQWADAEFATTPAQKLHRAVEAQVAEIVDGLQ